MSKAQTIKPLSKPQVQVLSGQKYNRDCSLYESPLYFSNGHWLVAKSRLRPGVADYIRSKSFVCELSDEAAAKVIPSETEVWDVTNELRDVTCRVRGTYQVRIVRHRGNSETAGLGLAYAAWLGLQPGSVLNGSKDGTRAFLTEAGDVIMPVRLD